MEATLDIEDCEAPLPGSESLTCWQVSLKDCSAAAADGDTPELTVAIAAHSDSFGQGTYSWTGDLLLDKGPTTTRDPVPDKGPATRQGIHY